VVVQITPATPVSLAEITVVSGLFFCYLHVAETTDVAVETADFSITQATMEAAASGLSGSCFSQPSAETIAAADDFCKMTLFRLPNGA
jgi:hypothetical protein